MFDLVVLGSVLIHLAANAIDDVYDYESQVGVVSNRMFPPDFGGWKILPRGVMTFRQAKLTAYFFFMLTLIVGLYLTVLTGPVVLSLGAVGLFFAYFHVAPPLRLGYCGLGLSELGIFYPSAFSLSLDASTCNQVTCLPCRFWWERRSDC